jgi:hypothetical protein
MSTKTKVLKRILTTALCAVLVLSVGIGAAYGANEINNTSPTIKYSSLKKITKSTWKKSAFKDWHKMIEYKEAETVEDLSDDLGNLLLGISFMKCKVTFSSDKKLSKTPLDYFAEKGKAPKAEVTIGGKTFKGKVDMSLRLDDTKFKWETMGKKKKYTASVKVRVGINFSKSDAYEILQILDNAKAGDKIVYKFKTPKLKTKYTVTGFSDGMGKYKAKTTYTGISKLSNKSFKVTEVLK